MRELLDAPAHATFRVDTLVKRPDGTIERTSERIPRAELFDQVRKKTAPLRRFTRGDVKALRLALGLTQEAFAQWLDVSVQTVQRWEQRTGVSAGPALRLLNIMNDAPRTFSRQIRSAVG
jgi:DNA-binding transcriptional regulator YiaG